MCRASCVVRRAQTHFDQHGVPTAVRPLPSGVNSRFQLCRFYLGNASCPRGETCTFAHGQEEHRQWTQQRRVVREQQVPPPRISQAIPWPANFDRGPLVLGRALACACRSRKRFKWRNSDCLGSRWKSVDLLPQGWRRLHSCATTNWCACTRQQRCGFVLVPL
jgi:hypothetical protein